MTRLTFAAGLAATLTLTTFGSEQPGWAQVAADGTLSTTVTSTDQRNFAIEGGDRAGANLFHSFRDFSIPTGGSAAFNNAPDIETIFSRVTGGTVSNIDGLIRANGTANLFLLNPAGILFGPNAQLDIGGSFVGTTASRIRFADGVEFSATDPSPSLLTVSVPVGLQMGQNSGTITVQGTGHQLAEGGFLPTDRRNNPTGLQVGFGQTLALIGGGVSFTGGVLTTNGGGHLEVGSVRRGAIGLTATAQGWVGEYSAVLQGDDIQLAQQSLLDASGVNGSIQLQGQTIRLTDGSFALIQNLGARSEGGIIVDAADSLTLTGNTSDGLLGSFIGIQNLGPGQAGAVTISAAQLTIENGGGIFSRTYSAANSGDLTVTVPGLIQVEGGAPNNPSVLSTIASSTLGSGNAGNLTISTGTLRLLSGGNVSSATTSLGQAGRIRVDAEDAIEVIGADPTTLSSSALVAGSLGAGNGNDVVINTARLLVQDSGVIGATALATGSTGNVIINASESVEVVGVAPGLRLPSRILAAVEIVDPVTQALLRLPPIPSGNAGSVTIRTPSLRLSDEGTVSVRNDGSGVAGDMLIDASSVRLNNQSSITASTASGTGGSIRFNVQDSVRLRNNSFISASAAGSGNGGRIAIAADRLALLRNSRITTQAIGAGNAGTLSLQVGDLSLTRSQIEVESEGSGDAGRLAIAADSMQLSDRSLINASTQRGRGGDVQLRVQDTLRLTTESQILANAQQAGQAGNVTIVASDAVLEDNSRISTNAQGAATGGELAIETDRLFLSTGSQITASTAGSGRAGSLRLRATDAITLEGTDTRLAAESATDAAAGSIFVQTPDLTVRDRASISGSGQGSGGAGDVTLRADRVQLADRGTLEANVAGGDQGNITVDANQLILRTGSRISTNATGDASGGNITLNADFIVAIAEENSDITANAENSFGGRVAIDATGVFGIQFREQLTPQSDITATSALGNEFSGTVEISNPEVDPGADGIELPESVVDASQEIATGCAEYANSQFIATGRGGLPSNPTESVGSDRPWTDVRDLSEFLSSSPSGATSETPTTDDSTRAPITEINGWVVNENGQVELVAIAAGQEPIGDYATCSTPAADR